MNNSYHLYVTGTDLVLRRETGYLRWRRIETVAEYAWQKDASLSSIFEGIQMASFGKAKLSVHVGSAWVKFITVALPAALKDRIEVNAAAHAQMQLHLGLDGREWVSTCDLVATPGKSIVCSVRRSLVEQLHLLAETHRLNLVSIRPFAAAVWNAAANIKGGSDSEFALMVIERDAMALFYEKDGALQSITSSSHHRQADVIEREINRVGYSFGPQAEENLRIAIAPSSAALAAAHSARFLDHDNWLEQRLYPDFRDLLSSNNESDR